MIQRLLVANRGEIARRIFRTCHRLGIETVAVFSDVDRSEPHALEADHSLHLPGVTAGETYLNTTEIVRLASDSGADAVHPGYGFLSENASFAEAVVESGLIWVGPTPDSMRRMGSKIEAKTLMAAAGVPILDGVDLSKMSEDTIRASADQIGYPILVKASAGGGGKGMRVIDSPADLMAAVEGASREAVGAFGDGTLFLEKYLTSPRHIEVQILGDTNGEVISLFERECSIQRRHQKIIEESPATSIDVATRKLLSQAAVAAGKAVDYVSAGTVEFIYQDNRFYFLEMNTRLQVEHPVTEMITSLDLVEIQLDIANGQPIPDAARNAVSTGHAVEARLYAEDPGNDFLPVTGTVERFHFNPHPGLRIDSGVEDGSAISVHYDPMMAKVVAHGESREEATRILSEALRSAHIHAPTTNRDLLVRILEDPEYLAGNIDTHFLERRDLAELSHPLATEADELDAARACALSDQLVARQSARVATTIPSGWRNQKSLPQSRAYSSRHAEHHVSYRLEGTAALFDGKDPTRIVTLEPSRVVLERNDNLSEFEISRYGDLRFVDTPEWSAKLVAIPRFPTARHVESNGSLRSPMPGKVVRIEVSNGDRVEEGQALVVLEAMKMEHTIRAPYRGTIEAVRFSDGDQVEADAVLVVVRPD